MFSTTNNSIYFSGGATVLNSGGSVSHYFLEDEKLNSIKLHYFLESGKEKENMVKPVRIIFNDPATIVYWEDGTKTVVKCAKDEKFIEEVGLAMAFMKKLYPKRGEFLRLVENAYRQEKMDK